MIYNEEQIKKAEKIVNEILKLARNTLLVKLRFLDAALHQLKPQPCIVAGFFCDGENLFYNLRNVLMSYKSEKEEIPRIYLHCLMHCIFRHMFVGPQINRELWDLACDIAVENAINELNLDCVKTAKSKNQESKLFTLKSKVKKLTAEKIYHYYKSQNLTSDKIQSIRNDFYLDDHSIWYMPPEEKYSLFGVGGTSCGQSGENEEGNNSEDDISAGVAVSVSLVEVSAGELEGKWQKISERIEMELESFAKIPGNTPGSMLQELKAVNRERYDYTEFLKKFMTMGEVMQINDDEFDYVFYTYGLKLYKNMPLIEPLEYKEVKRIKEFVIAIDTSGSTSGELVQRFLNKTYNILKQQENFFTKINLHIIQCDADVQEDAKITTQEEFDKFIKTMKIRGLGGTDFKPVFTYVDKLIEQKEFINLKGLIYFTDGWGDFPKLKPDYDTAFVFIDDDYNNYNVPVWAIKLILQPDEI